MLHVASRPPICCCSCQAISHILRHVRPITRQMSVALHCSALAVAQEFSGDRQVLVKRQRLCDKRRGFFSVGINPKLGERGTSPTKSSRFFMVALLFREAGRPVAAAISARSSLRVPNSYMWRWAAKAWPAAAAARCPQGGSQRSSPRRMGKPRVVSPGGTLARVDAQHGAAHAAVDGHDRVLHHGDGRAPPRARSVA